MAYFYSSNFSSAECTVEYLGRCKEHLAKLIAIPGGLVSHGVKYARVLFLLGESPELVEETFKSVISACETNKQLAKAHEHFGCLCLALNRYEDAKRQFEQSIAKSKRAPYTARKALKMIEFETENRQHQYDY